MNMCNNKWFALSVWSRQEQAVAANLMHKGHEVFLPFYRVRRKWSDRIKVVDLPLFPGYVFCHFDLANKATPVVTTPGVIRLLGSGTGPEPVDEREIHAIQQIVASKLPTGPWPYLREGVRVQVRSGPLTGVEGLVVTVKSQAHLVVSITLLGRSVAVDIDPASVKTISTRAELPMSQYAATGSHAG
jgi:transcription antitermination factor NusG